MACAKVSYRPHRVNEIARVEIALSCHCRLLQLLLRRFVSGASAHGSHDRARHRLGDRRVNAAQPLYEIALAGTWTDAAPVRKIAARIKRPNSAILPIRVDRRRDPKQSLINAGAVVAARRHCPHRGTDQFGPLLSTSSIEVRSSASRTRVSFFHCASSGTRRSSAHSSSKLPAGSPAACSARGGQAALPALMLNRSKQTAKHRRRFGHCDSRSRHAGRASACGPTSLARRAAQSPDAVCASASRRGQCRQTRLSSPVSGDCKPLEFQADVRECLRGKAWSA